MRLSEGPFVTSLDQSVMSWLHFDHANLKIGNVMLPMPCAAKELCNTRYTNSSAFSWLVRVLKSHPVTDSLSVLVLYISLHNSAYRTSALAWRINKFREPAPTIWRSI